MRNLKIIVQSESIIGKNRIANLKIIVQSESIRGNEENAGVSLKFTILSVTRTVIIKQSHSREFYAPSRAYFLQLQHPIHLEPGKNRQRRRCKKSQKLKETGYEEDTRTKQHRIINSKRAR